MPVFTCFLFPFFLFFFFISATRYNRESRCSLVDYIDRSRCRTPPRTVARALRVFTVDGDISRSWDRFMPTGVVDIVSGSSTCTRVSSIRSDHGAGSRRCFRRFALVCHNCFRPSSRLRHLDIVSFRYFRFQAHRSMSALPSTFPTLLPTFAFTLDSRRLFIFLSRIFNPYPFLDFWIFLTGNEVKSCWINWTDWIDRKSL